MAVLLAPDRYTTYPAVTQSYASDEYGLITVTNTADYVRLLALGCADFPTNTQNTIPGVYNFDPRFLSKWRAGKAGLVAGSYRPRIACVGDSTTLGTGAGTSTSRADARKRCYPAYLRKFLADGGLPAQANSFFGDGGIIGELTTYDPRLSLSADWSVTSVISLGGQALRCNSPNTGTLAFTPTVSFDTIDVYYVAASGAATFTVNVDGGATLATINANATRALNKQTISCTAGTHTINVNRTAGGTAYIVGIDAYTAGTKEVAVWNMGRGSWTSVDWSDVTNAESPANGIAAVAPDLTIIDLGINDWNAPTALATYTANIQTIITKAKQSGDVLLVGPVPSDPGSYASVATQATYLAALRGLAVQNDCPMVDITYRLQSYSVSNALGLYYDGLHLKEPGYADKARPIANLLLAA